MSSEGLSLFMDEARSSQIMSNNADMTVIMEFVTLMSKQNRSQAENNRLDELRALMAPQQEQEPKEVFHDFVVPEHDLESWKNHLLTTEHIRPTKHIHFKVTAYNAYRNLNAESYEVDVEDFAINHRDNAITARQRTNGPNYTENQLRDLYSEGLRLARANNRTAQTRPKNWELLKRGFPNDSRDEDMLLRFNDTERKVLNWTESIYNLKKFGEENGYSLDHYKQALGRWVSFFLPSLQRITDNLSSPNEIARLLIEMHPSKSQFDSLQDELQNLVRQPGETLESKIALLRSLANVMFKDHNDAERLANVERILINGVIQFTEGTTKRNTELFIQFQRRQGKPLIFEHVLKGAVNSERVYGKPKIPLSYNEPMNPVSAVYNVVTKK